MYGQMVIYIKEFIKMEKDKEWEYIKVIIYLN